jgi:hypothetical protein
VHYFSTAGSDYTPPSGRFVVDPGESTACLTFNILNDNLVEGMESLSGRIEGIIDSLNALVTSPERITFSPRDATLNILDTDSKQ